MLEWRINTIFNAEVPDIIGKNGIEEIIELDLTPEEKEQFAINVRRNLVYCIITL